MKQYSLKGAVLSLALLASVGMAAAQGFEDAKIYGYSTASPTGMYELFPEGLELRWADKGYAGRIFVPVQSGWLDAGKLCGYAPDIYAGKVYDNTYVEFDWETGEVLASKQFGTAAAMQSATLNAGVRTIYGYGFSGDKKCFLSAPADAPESITVIREVADNEFCGAMTYNSTSHTVVGMRNDGIMVKVDAEGVQTPIFTTGVSVASGTYPALAYSEVDGLYYWNFMGSDWMEALYVLDPDTQTANKITTFPERLCKFLVAGKADLSANAPKAPEVVSLDFPWGATDGSAVIVMPEKTIFGKELSGALHWHAEIDGNAAADGTAEAGERVEIPFKKVATGQHVFTFYVLAGDERGESVDYKIFVGVDTPAAPENVICTGSTVSWNAVTKGAHDGFISTENLVYTVYVNGEQVGTTQSTSSDLPVKDNTSLQLLKASVTASASGLTSAPGYAAPVVVGDMMTLPMTLKPTADDFTLCTVLDGNNDGKGWTFNSDESAFFSGYSDNKALDDWLFLPPVNLSAGGVYYFSMDAHRRFNSYDAETLEVCVGNATTAEAMKQGVVIKSFKPAYEFEEYSGTVEVPTDGKWYIALHCTSRASQGGVYVKNISLLDNGVDASSPAAVTSLLAVPAADGLLEATVTFRFPEQTVGGTTLDPAVALTAKVTAASVQTVTGLPGQEVSATVTTVQGLNRITVEPLLGDKHGLVAEVEVYTGVTVPSVVSDIKAMPSKDMMSATLTWSAPAVGVDGGFIRPDELTYSVYILTSTLLGDAWEKVADGIKECSYTYTTSDPTQECYELGVSASNAAGECPEHISVLTVLGTPFSLPMVETFDTSSIYTYFPWVIYAPTSEYNTQWGPLPKSVLTFLDDANGNAVCGMGLSENALGKAGFPIFSTKDYTEGVKVETTFWTGDGATPDIRITALAHGLDNPVTVAVVEPDWGWKHVEFNLPEEMLGKEWVSMFIETSFPEGSAQWVVLDDYSISGTSGIEDVAGENVAVVLSKGAVDIKAPAGTPVCIVDMAGRSVFSDVVGHSGTASVSLASGFYVVKAGSETIKVAVK